MRFTWGLVGLLLLGCDNKNNGSEGDDTGGGGGGDDTGGQAIDNDGDGSPEGEDCDDGDPAVYPGATEICNDLDDDCDALVDDDDSDVDLSTGTLSYTDADGDGHGDPAQGTAACVVPAGASLSGDDCNDATAAISPSAAEVCNALDDDCDGLTDDADDSLDLSTAGVFYADADGDGFGDAGVMLQVCSPSSSYVADATDCDDTNGAISPGATERCNGIDDDCNSSTGEAGTIDLGGVGYRDLARALGAATSGDTVTLCEGTYVGAFTVPDGVALASLSGAKSTILEGDGSGTAAILTLEGAASLYGLTLTAGASTYGGAVDAFSSWAGGDIHIEDCVLDGNTAVYGGAVLIYPTISAPSLLTLVDTTLSNNVAYGTDSAGTEYGYGGALYLVGDLEGSGVVFDGNLALTGGAILIGEGAMALDSASALTNNGAYASAAGSNGDGGAIVAEGTVVVLDGTRVEGNYADLFGGGMMLYGADLEGGTFSSNEAGLTGGGLYVLATTSISVSGVTLSSNGGQYAGGAMLHVASASAILTFEDSLLETNYASENGGGAWAYSEDDGTVSADTVVFDANEAGVSGGGLYLEGDVSLLGIDVEAYDNVSDLGGGLFVASGLAYLIGGQVTGNTAYTAGGGAYLLAGELEAVRSDWGSGSLDNDPEDVYIEATGDAYDSYGASASFICDTGGC